ncbi:MAG: pyruvate:ferredoxin (flavodoxin) oxidoreductase [Bacilli bacterium]
MKNYKVMDGNEACARGAYLFSEICGIYPITPASPMATLCDKWSNQDKRNIFNSRVNVVEMQSEAGASALIHGALQSGSLSTTFTSSQGLLLMIPSMYKMAGELLPAVIHVAARSLSTHALSIFGDHQDVYATRSTGFAILSSSNVQDAYNLGIVSHLSAISGQVPFLHFFDGFRTSHEINKINILDDKIVSSLLDIPSLNKFKNRAINIGNNVTRGMSQTEDIYFQNTESRNKYYNDLPNIVESYMNKINVLSGSNYKPFVYYGALSPTKIIIAMGSVTDTIASVVDELNKNKEEVGLIIVYLYRPFSVEHLLKVLPNSVESIAVLDRTKEAGSNGEPLYLDIVEALNNKNIKVYGGRYGLSSKNVTPSSIKSVFDNLSLPEPLNHFTIGINDDVTHLSLETSLIKINHDYKELKIYGFGSDGMVGASKNILKLIGSKEETFIQGYFEYDSKKSSGITVSHLRIGPTPINAPYYCEDLSLIVISKDLYLQRYNCLEGIKENAILLINSNKTDIELNDLMNDETKKTIKQKHIQVFITSSQSLADKYHLNGKINNIMSSYILKFLGSKKEDLISFENMIKETYIKKGEEIVNNNINAFKEADEYLRELDTSILDFEEIDTIEDNDVMSRMMKRTSSSLPVSAFLPHTDGTFKGGSSALEKRKTSDHTPHWIKENCIECNQCSFVCPHGVIRPFSLDEKELLDSGLTKNDTIDSLGEKNKQFYLSVSSSNCTGCGLCVDTCIGKNNKKALSLEKYNEKDDILCDKLSLIGTNNTIFNKFTVKGLGFEKPKFEFPGACAGCGETPYLKALTSLYGENIVIANATGCSSIYSSSLPSTPYSIPWISSLFEDNAEFGLGILTSYETTRRRIEEIIYDTKDNVTPEIKSLYKEWLDNKEDYKITSKVKEELLKLDIPNPLKELSEYIVSRNVWTIGGDGWAYDIGYGGLDHVLRSNKNVKILVLDTEVYSNTGGQTSKATRTSAIAEFSSNGKLNPKKDLFRSAMSIPNVYVASICEGASMQQTITAFKEATEHIGPSIIIAYSPCIAHGIKGGLVNTLKEEKLLVSSGYNILMRYNPENDKLTIDSKEPDFSLYEEVFNKELRYKNLSIINENNYKELYNQNLDQAKKRYSFYKDYSLKTEGEI